MHSVCAGRQANAQGAGKKMESDKQTQVIAGTTMESDKQTQVGDLVLLVTLRQHHRKPSLHQEQSD